jgi:hypothetical protein
VTARDGIRTPLRPLIVGAILSMACANPPPQAGDPGTGAESDFRHTLTTGALPWSHERFDAPGNGFTFAIFSDLNGGERERIFEVAVAQLNLLQPELIMSVGDLIDGGTEDVAQLAREWESFDARADRTEAPIFYVGGNHDLTNLVMRDVWEERYGARYYHFVYKDVLFLVLDTEDNSPERMREIYEARADYIRAMDEEGAGPEELRQMTYFNMPERSTGGVGPEQSEYILQAIAQNPGVRWTFVFLHKPIWQADPADPEFLAIEAALEDRPYTLFNGHFHSYDRVERNGREYITLGTTGGSQSASDPMAFDHLTLVSMTPEGPVIANLRMDGILDADGRVPLGGDTLCYQASRC